MAVIEIAKIQVRRGQELQTGIPQLDPGELGWAEDTQRLYIGKRIIEGANSDENTRILTEPDLDNIFNLIGSTVTQAIAYQYREGVSYISSTTVRTLQSKLDDTVSLTDYGVVPGVTGTNITTALKHAVAGIFNALLYDSTERKDARRSLSIPAGDYVISDVVELPPYTTLVGEGLGLTTLRLVNTTTSIFKTIDADGAAFESNDMDSGVKRAKDVTIKGMTLEYAVTATSNNPLISLDNVLHAHITNVEFRTAINTTSTTTYGLVSHGIGIGIRGTGGGIGSGNANLCENVLVTDCTFDSLLTGVETTGSVIRPVIENSVFSNLDRGVKLFTVDTTPAPMGGIFKNNRFENIVKEGIYSEETLFNPAGTNHLSENNFFYQVGNGLTLSDSTTTTQTAVITFYGQGNRSINDYFYRQLVANTTDNPDFYYNPLVVGTVSVVNNTVYPVALTSGTNAITTVTRFALIGTEQKLDVDYKLFDSKNQYSRTGKLLINVSKPTYPTGKFDTVSTASSGATVIYLGAMNTGTYEIATGDSVSGTGITVGTSVTTIADLTATITATSPIGNIVTCDSTEGFSLNDALTLTTAFGPLAFTVTNTVTYFVKTIVGPTTFTLSTSSGGVVLPLTTATGSSRATSGIQEITLSNTTTNVIPPGTSITFTKFYESYGSLSDYYNFSYVEDWPHSDPDTPAFSITEPVNNYVELKFTNWSPEDFDLEFQIVKST